MNWVCTVRSYVQVSIDEQGDGLAAEDVKMVHELSKICKIRPGAYARC